MVTCEIRKGTGCFIVSRYRIVARGYAIVKKKDDKPLTSTKNITEGDQLTVQNERWRTRSRGENVN